jgi:hypothetical protein
MVTSMSTDLIDVTADNIDLGWLDDADCYDPWCNWLQGLGFPRCGYGPLEAWLEHDIEDAITAADRLRLATAPTTKLFTIAWDNFKRQHEELECRGKYRRLRYMTWRATALKVLCERHRFQDEADAHQARDKLLATLKWFWPDIDMFGNFGTEGGNFWRVGDREHPDQLAQYAIMVLLLMRLALRPSRQSEGALF